MLHRIEEALNLDALIPGQVKPITELENMARTGISIELGGKCQAHATSGSKIVDTDAEQPRHDRTERGGDHDKRESADE